jgi:Cu2+-exporting ATPase
MFISLPPTAETTLPKVDVDAEPSALRDESEDWFLLDDIQEWRAFSRELGDGSRRWESNLVIEGMHCAACAVSVEEALQGVPGVERAEVSAASRRARVTWLSDSVVPSRWMQAVAASGYKALPANDAFASERRQQENRTALWRMAVAGFCMMQVMMYAWPAYIARPGDLSGEMEQLLRWASWVLSLPVIFFSCGPFFRAAWRDVRQRRVSMDLPVALGMGLTFAVSTAGTFDPQGPFGHEVFFDSLTMFVFFLLTGRWLELRLRDRTAGALDALMNRLPDSIIRLDGNGAEQRVALRHLQLGDRIRILPGEAIPADGVVCLGRSLVDEALLTGESTPLPRTVGDRVIAGSHNLMSALEVRVEQLGGQTRYAQIVALMERASTDKPQLAQLADQWAKPFLIAVLMAAALALVLRWGDGPAAAVMLAVAILVVTCPCALSLATPAAMLASAGSLARSAILTRRLQAIEALSQVDTVVFDKTGTLTTDQMTVTSVQVRSGLTQDEALTLAGRLSAHSLHPVSRALTAAAHLRPAAEPQDAAVPLGEVQEVVGQGLRAAFTSAERETTELRLGSAQFCGIPAPEDTVRRAYLRDAAGWLATFELSEQLRDDAMVCVLALKADGLNVQLLSGDSPRSVQLVGKLLQIERAQGGCSPQDKLQILRQAQAAGKRVAVVGDGLNDGPALAGAHVSFAVGSGVPLAQAQADFVLLGENLAGVARAVRLAKRTMRVVRQNLVWAAAYNAVCVPLAAAGALPAWLAGLGMACSSLLVVLNALRLARAVPSLEG